VASIMMLGLGPVMRYELVTTARRGRYYLARVVYGLCLLGLLWREFADSEQYYPGGGTIDQVHQFAESVFVQFAGAQGLTLLFLIPALVAGVIADEHQRKTLHYLLASRLSSAEIVLGK
jgi:ABC-type transport system involved in multi-copper enzyme maturation permease subunit